MEEREIPYGGIGVEGSGGGNVGGSGGRYVWKVRVLRA